LREYNKYLLQARREMSAISLDLETYWDSECGNEPGGGRSDVDKRERRSTFKCFMSRLPAAEIYESIDIAVGRKPPGYSDKYTFKYFCGVCWNKIKKREGTAE
jgi:hypothetical protein